MKRMLCKEIILVLGMCLFFSTLVFAGSNEDAGIRFDLDATTYGNQNDTIMTIPGVGDYIRVDVYAINVHNLDTYEFEILYDTDVFQYVTSSATNPLTFEENILTTEGGTAVGWMVDTSNPGILSIAYTLTGIDTLEAPEGVGLIADIVFQVLSTIGDSLTFGDVYFYDSFGVMDIISDKGIAIISGIVSIDDNGFDTTFEETKLENNPNPVQDTALIEYAVKGMLRTESVKINIYNARGQFVESIEGRNGRAVWNTKKHPNGVYFYKIDNDNFSKISKTVLVH